MPTSKKPSSKLRYSALFAGRRPTNLPYILTDIQKTVDDAVRDIVHRRSQLKDGVEVIVEQNRLDGGSGSSVAKVNGTIPLDMMPPVAIYANRERLKVKIDKDFFQNGNDGVQRGISESSSKRRWTMNGKMPGLATTFRYRMRNILLVSRCTDPSLSRAVACVVWDGYDASTASWLHLHVFWFVGHDGSGGSKSDALQTEVGNAAAETFVRHMSRYIETSEHQERVRHLGADMVARGQLDLLATTMSGDAISRVAPRRSFSVPSPVTSQPIEITGGAERSTFLVGSIEASATPKDEDYADQHGINGHVIKNGVSEVNEINKTGELDGEISFVVNQRGRVRLSASIAAAAARSSFTATSGSSVDHSSRQTVHDVPPTFTTDHGLSPDDVDCTALRSRIARFDQLVANNNGNQHSVSYLRHQSSSQYDDGMMYSAVSTLERSGGSGTNTMQVPAPIASLSGELKSRLNSGAPILLPPKDYDTVNRHRGNLVGIEVRRCQQENVVGRGSTASSVF